jgi:hypothetical protein
MRLANFSLHVVKFLLYFCSVVVVIKPETFVLHMFLGMGLSACGGFGS